MYVCVYIYILCVHMNGYVQFTSQARLRVVPIWGSCGKLWDGIVGCNCFDVKQGYSFLFRTRVYSRDCKKLVYCGSIVAESYAKSIAKSNLFGFSVFSKEPIQESQVSPQLGMVLTWCSRRRIPAVWALIPTPCSVLFFVSYVVNEKNDEQFFAEAFVLTATSNLSSFSCVCFIWSLHGWKSIWPGACGGWWQQLSKQKILAGVWTFRSASGQPLSVKTQTISNTFYHVWSHAW